MEKDNNGYAMGNWHPIAAEHNDARNAWNLAGSCSDGVDRIEAVELELKKLRRQIEDRLRKDRHFLYEVAALIA